MGIISYYDESYEQVETYIERANINHAIKVDYLQSPEVKLIEQIYSDESWSDRVYASIRNSPLVLISSVGTAEELRITLVGSSERFFFWYNDIHESIPSHIEIESIVATGDSISFQCKITPMTKGI